MAEPRLEFDRETVPWLDRYVYEVDAYVRSLEEPPTRFDLREKLLHWMRFGYVTFPGLVDRGLVDDYVADLDELFASKERHSVVLNVEGIGERPVRELSDDDLRHPHLLILDFHNSSVTGKELALHADVVCFLGHVFRDDVVAMQTLTFLHGTEQYTHQDFPYVVSGIPSHLAASWIALEDVHPDAGPLMYYPGSHTIEKFDWGDGLVLTQRSSADELQFRDHLEAACARVGLARQVFLPKKGDVFIWHAALAHGGSAVADPTRTRRSLVTHFSTATAYPRDRRAPDQEPVRYERNGGILYAHPRLLDEEDSFPLRRPLAGARDATAVHVPAQPVGGRRALGRARRGPRRLLWRR